MTTPASQWFTILNTVRKRDNIRQKRNQFVRKITRYGELLLTQPEGCGSNVLA